MGYCWPGRLRPAQTPELSRLACYPHLLRGGQPGFVGQRSGEGALLPCAVERMVDAGL